MKFTDDAVAGRTIGPFRFWCQKVLPLVYDDSLSYYELLCKVVKKLNEVILSNDELVAAFQTLKDYVDNYFSSVDFQNLVKDALDEMVEDGTLGELINETLFATKVTHYDTFGDIPSTGLSVGDVCVTAGFYTVGDGGGCRYVVTDIGYPSNTAYYFKIEEPVNVLALGCKSDGSADITDIINNALSFYKSLYFPSGRYLCDSSISVTEYGVSLVGDNAVIYRDTYNGHSIIISGVDMCCVEGFKFIGNDVPSNVFKFISCINSSRVTIKNCHFEKGYGYCIRFNNNSNSCIKDCEFKDVNGESGDPGGGVYMQGGHDIIYSNISGNDLLDHTLYVDGSVEVYNLTIDNIITKDAKDGRLTSAATIVMYGNCHDVAIQNCVCTNINEGIRLGERDGYLPHDVVINNVVVNSCALNGISIIGNSYTSEQLVNVCINCCTFNDVTQDGISVRYCENVRVGNCHVKGGRYGFENSYNKNAVYSNCRADGCATGFMIGFSGLSEEIKVILCESVNNSQYGIHGRNSNDCLIVLPMLHNNTGGNMVCTGINTYILAPMVTSADALSSVIYNSAAPTVGYYKAGDICIDSTGATSGWVCTASGDPGTWVARS